ncbi:MAG: DUF429 domain-containing protein [Actinomycetota bacterium]
MRALGIDVGVRKGLDLVLLDGSLQPLEQRRRVTIDDLAAEIDALAPDAIAIDGPPSWGKTGGRSRRTEQELRRFGIGSYGTPSDPARGDHPFFSWMVVSFRVFEVAARSGFPRYATGSVRGTAMEVFPHASAVVLAGALPPAGSPKHVFRRAVLSARGVRTAELQSADQVDAALAALTGLFALHGERFAPGDPKEGVIVLPARTLPPPPYRRAVAPPNPEYQLHLPGLSPCVCGDPGCASLTASEFAPGHATKRKALLWAIAREGDAAEAELRRRGWELPAELR